MVKVLSAKLPEELVASLDAAAAEQGVTRNRLVREALEATVEGRIRQLTEDERESRRIRKVRDRFERDRRAMRVVSASGRSIR